MRPLRKAGNASRVGRAIRPHSADGGAPTTFCTTQPTLQHCHIAMEFQDLQACHIHSGFPLLPGIQHLNQSLRSYDASQCPARMAKTAVRNPDSAKVAAKTHRKNCWPAWRCTRWLVLVENTSPRTSAITPNPKASTQNTHSKTPYHILDRSLGGPA